VASCVLIVVTILFNIFSVVKLWAGDSYVNNFLPVPNACLSTVPLWQEWILMSLDIIIRVTVNIIWNFIFVLQIFEITAMLYIIESQRDNSVEELYYQYNAENMEESSTSQKYSFRHKELRI
jgi:hypothetical protein